MEGCKIDKDLGAPQESSLVGGDPEQIKNVQAPIDYKSIVGLVLFVFGISLSLAITYMTVGPYGTTTAVVSGVDFILHPQQSSLVVDYDYKVNDNDYEGQVIVPITYHREFSVGSNFQVNYIIYNPKISGLGNPPPPSPLFLFTGFFFLLGVVLLFRKRGV